MVDEKNAASKRTSPFGVRLAGTVVAVVALALLALNMGSTRGGERLNRAGLAMELKSAARAYFEVWNQHSVSGLEAMLAPMASLRDWDISAHGAAEVAAANGKIFTKLPNVRIEMMWMHASPDTRAVAAEILVHTGAPLNTVLKVVDIIEFTTDGKIASVRAYKQ